MKKFFVMAMMMMAAITASAQYEPGTFSIQPRIGFTASTMSAESAQISNESGSNGVLSLLKKTGKTISGVLDQGAQIINRFVESIAVFIVTSCIIPILVLAFVLWLIKLLFGVKIVLPQRKKSQEKVPPEE